MGQISSVIEMEQVGREGNEDCWEKLREICKERGIYSLRVDRDNKISIGYIECINSVVVYSNATNIHINSMTEIVSHIIPT